MYQMAKTQVGEWLEKKYLEWQTQVGERKTVGAFAAHLGVDRVLLSRWMNGQSNPDKSSADKIALCLGNEIFDLLGMEKPDQRLQTIIKHWRSYPESVKDDLARRAESAGDGSTVRKIDNGVAHFKRR